MDRQQDDVTRDRRDDDMEHADSDQIRNRIEQTRSRLDRTVDEVVDRLRPRTIAHELVEMLHFDSESTARMRAKVGRFGSRLTDQVANNPVPTLLIGAGLCWLAFKGRGDKSHHETGSMEPYQHAYGDFGDVSGESANGDSTLQRAKETAKDVAERTKHAAVRVKDAAAHAASGVKDAASHAASGIASGARSLASGARTAWSSTSSAASSAADSTRRALHRSKDAMAVAAERMRSVYHDAPLAVGAGAAVAGIVCGLLLPRTRAEDRAMGKWSDDMKDDIAERAADLKERAVETASEAGHRVAETASEAGRRVAEAVGEAGTKVVHQVQETIEEQVPDAGNSRQGSGEGTRGEGTRPDGSKGGSKGQPSGGSPSSRTEPPRSSGAPKRPLA